MSCRTFRCVIKSAYKIPIIIKQKAFPSRLLNLTFILIFSERTFTHTSKGCELKRNLFVEELRKFLIKSFCNIKYKHFGYFFGIKFPSFASNQWEISVVNVFSSEFRGQKAASIEEKIFRGISKCLFPSIRFIVWLGAIMEPLWYQQSSS